MKDFCGRIDHLLILLKRNTNINPIKFLKTFTIRQVPSFHVYIRQVGSQCHQGVTDSYRVSKQIW